MCTLQYRGGDEAHGALAAVPWPYIDVHGEAAAMANGVGAQLLHRLARIGLVKRCGERARNRHAPLQTKQVIDAAGPAQAIVVEIAVPQANAPLRQCLIITRGTIVERHRSEMPVQVVERPAMVQGKGLGRAQAMPF